MMYHLHCKILTAVFIAGLLFQTSVRAGDQDLIGQPAPELKGVFAVNGQPVNLSELKGKVVLVDFWAVWCAPCKAVFPHLRQWHDKYKDKGLTVVGVTSYYKEFDFDKNAGKLDVALTDLTEQQEHEMLKNFADHYDLKYLILTLTEEDWKKAGEDYGIQAIPTAVLIDQKGIVRLIRVGAGQKNAEIIEQEIEKMLGKGSSK